MSTNQGFKTIATGFISLALIVTMSISMFALGVSIDKKQARAVGNELSFNIAVPDPRNTKSSTVPGTFGTIKFGNTEYYVIGYNGIEFDGGSEISGGLSGPSGTATLLKKTVTDAIMFNGSSGYGYYSNSILQNTITNWYGDQSSGAASEFIQDGQTSKTLASLVTPRDLLSSSKHGTMNQYFGAGDAQKCINKNEPDTILSSDNSTLLNQSAWALSTLETCKLAKQGFGVENGLSIGWWLRSPGYDNYKAARVEPSSAINPYGGTVSTPGKYGYRPALYINIKPVALPSATLQVYANGATNINYCTTYSLRSCPQEGSLSGQSVSSKITLQGDDGSDMEPERYIKNNIISTVAPDGYQWDGTYHYFTPGDNGAEVEGAVVGADDELSDRTNTIIGPHIDKLFTITFKSQGQVYSTQVVKNGGKVIKPVDPPARTGFTFGGWWYALQPYSFDTPVTKDMTLAAGWIFNKYTITFDSNGGSDVYPEIVNYNGRLKKPADPVKVNYDFVGWFTDLELTNEYDFNTLITGDFTLYAKWIAKQCTNGATNYPDCDDNKPKPPVDPTCTSIQHLFNHKCVDNFPTSVKLNLDKVYLNNILGDRDNFTLLETAKSIYGNLSSANQKVTWSSSDKSVALVNFSGKVTAKKTGVTTITVKTINGLTAKCKVIVKLPQVYRYDHNFSDIKSLNKDFTKYVEWMFDFGVTTGDGKGHYLPNNLVRRDQMAMFIYRLMGSPDYTNKVKNFSDVKKNAGSYQSVMWLVNNKITTGFDSKHYNPSGNVSRMQMALFMYRLAGSPKESTSNIYKVTDWDKGWNKECKQAINFLLANGVSTQKKAAYNASSFVTRAQMAAFMDRLYDNVLVK